MSCDGEKEATADSYADLPKWHLAATTRSSPDQRTPRAHFQLLLRAPRTRGHTGCMPCPHLQGRHSPNLSATATPVAQVSRWRPCFRLAQEDTTSGATPAQVRNHVLHLNVCQWLLLRKRDSVQVRLRSSSPPPTRAPREHPPKLAGEELGEGEVARVSGFSGAQHQFANIRSFCFTEPECPDSSKAQGPESVSREGSSTG